MVQKSSGPQGGGSPAGGKQFLTLQGLRGLAALWVVLFHAKTLGALHNTYLDQAGILTHFVFDFGRGGVAVFFVLSGFVIAHSVADKEIDLRFVGRFALRRSIRLDPPYWISIIVAIVFLYYRATNNGTPYTISTRDVLLHTAYMQELFHAKEILVVYWTLTYEVQFYLIYVITFYLFYNARAGRSYFQYPAAATVLILTVIALYGATKPNEWALRGLFVNYWFAFVAGVFAYYGGYRKSNLALGLALLLCGLMLSSAHASKEVFNSPAAVTGLGLAALGRLGHLSTYLSHRLFQRLGDISYSLYLIHIPALVIGISIGTRIFPVSTIGAIALFMASVALTLVLASAFWWAVERPAHALAKRIGVDRQRRAQSGVAGAMNDADQAFR